MKLFQRLRLGRAASDEQTLAARAGKDLLAVRVDSGSAVPQGCSAVIFNENGQARRLPDFHTGGTAQRLSYGEKESAWCFHPGPYHADLVPFALAPEIGLRLQFVVDTPDPRVSQQRFDLFLASEAGEGRELSVQAFSAMLENALRLALAQGRLELPPCTAPEEWIAFRAGLNELLYTRFGITVEDCMPVDLGDTIDFAAILRARVDEDAITAAPAVPPAGDARSAPVTPSARDEAAGEALWWEPSSTQAAGSGVSGIPAAGAPGWGAADHGAQSSRASAQAGLDGASVASGVAGGQFPAPAAASGVAALDRSARDDATALRRLFLELPALSGGLRMLELPQGQGLFLVHQGLLQRLALLALDVNTMPALALAAPGQPLPAARQHRRSGYSAQAVAALDEAWGLLARLKLAAPAAAPALLDDADRILANMELSLERRRAAYDARQAPGAATAYELPRIEPSL